MPMYRYRCTECGAQEEHLQKFSDPPLEICGSCGGALAKQMTAAAFHLKGGGWYKDLYASAKPGESGGKSDSGGSASASAGGKSESAGKSDASTSSSSSSSSSTSAPSTGSSSSTSSSAA